MVAVEVVVENVTGPSGEAVFVAPDVSLQQAVVHEMTHHDATDWSGSDSTEPATHQPKSWCILLISSMLKGLQTMANQQM